MPTAATIQLLDALGNANNELNCHRDATVAVAAIRLFQATTLQYVLWEVFGVDRGSEGGPQPRKCQQNSDNRQGRGEAVPIMAQHVSANYQSSLHAANKHIVQVLRCEWKAVGLLP